MYITGTNCNGEFVTILNRYEINILIEALLKKNTEVWNVEEDE